MSKQVVIQMLERALNDQAFAKQLKTNFDAAIKGYDLIADEIAALKKGDEGTLRDGRGRAAEQAVGCIALRRNKAAGLAGALARLFSRWKGVKKWLKHPRSFTNVGSSDFGGGLSVTRIPNTPALNQALNNSMT